MKKAILRLGVASLLSLFAYVLWLPGTGLARYGPITIKRGAVLKSVACPSLTQCTATDGGGHEVTFNPRSPGAPKPTTIFEQHGSYRGEGRLACPSPIQCTAIHTGGLRIACTARALACTQYVGFEDTFNPTSPGTPKAVAIDGTKLRSTACGELPGPNPPTECFTYAGSLFDVACPSVRQCTVVDDIAHELTFDPALPLGASDFFLGSFTGPDGLPTGLEGVACPSISQCTAVDDVGEVTFNPTAPGTPPRVRLGLVEPAPGLACPSVTLCVQADTDRGKAVIFNPLAPGSRRGTTLLGPSSLHGVACPSATQCTAIAQSYAGHEWAVTFNPATPGKPRRVLLGKRGDPILTSIACPSATQCTAVNLRGGEVTFNPNSRPTRSSSPRRGSPRH